MRGANDMLNIDLIFFESLKRLPLKDAILKAALWYAKQGYKVLPLLKGTKKLAIGEEYASSDPAIIKEWFTRDFIEGNIALYLRDTGVSVLDGDRHGEVDGFKNAGIDDAAFDGLVAKTPHEGLHLYIQGELALKKLPKGLEHKTTRVIVAPSVVDGVAYEWRCGGEPQPLSQKLISSLRGLKIVSNNVEPIGAKTPREQVLAEISLSGYTSTPVAPAGYCKRLLEHMDPGCDYDEWSRVGMALHHNDDSETSLEIWREWSAESPKYQEGECDKKWASFNSNRENAITLRWLILKAKENGCPDSPEDMTYYGTSLSIDREVAAMNKKYVYRQMQNGARICWLERTSEGRLQLFSWKESDFKSLLQNKYILVGTKAIPAAEAWLHSHLRRTGEVNMWEVGKEPPGALNLFQGLAVQPVPCLEKEVKFFLDFTLDVICRGNKEHQTYLLDLLAFKVQRPLDISGICLVLQGGEGTGKGSLCRVMETIMGRQHASTVSQRNSLLGEYAGGLIASSLWVTSNEAIWAGHHGEAERLKAMITEPNLEWNEKFQPMWEQRNCIQLSITTNNDWAVPADFDSRRFFVLRIADIKAKNGAYWKEFNELLGRDAYWRPNNPEYLGKVVYFLQQRKITSDFTNALETEWLKEQRQNTAIDSTEDAFVSWVKLFLQENAGDVYVGRTDNFTFPVVTRKGESYIVASNLYEDYAQYAKRHFRSRRVYPHEKFNQCLRSLGMLIMRVKKDSLMLGQSKYPGDPEGKVTIVKLLRPNELEQALATQYRLLTPDIEESED